MSEMDLIAGNRTRIFDLQDHLRRAFQDFCNTYHEEIPYIDAFLGVHNFHKLIVEDIVRRQEEKGVSPLLRESFCKMAAYTFEEAMIKLSKKCLENTKPSTEQPS